MGGKKHPLRLDQEFPHHVPYTFSTFLMPCELNYRNVSKQEKK